MRQQCRTENRRVRFKFEVLVETLRAGNEASATGKGFCQTGCAEMDAICQSQFDNQASTIRSMRSQGMGLVGNKNASLRFANFDNLLERGQATCRTVD